MGSGAGDWLSAPRGMDFNMPKEHAAQVSLIGRDLEKPVLLLLRPYIGQKRCRLAVLYPGAGQVQQWPHGRLVLELSCAYRAVQLLGCNWLLPSSEQ